jgi:hypothetical protein
VPLPSLTFDRVAVNQAKNASTSGRAYCVRCAQRAAAS